MVDVNFHQAAEKDLMISRKKTIFNSAYFVAIVLVSFVSLVYSATLMYRNILSAKNVGLEDAKNKEINSIDLKELNKLDDFRGRLDSSIFNLTNKKNPEDVFSLVEKLIVKGSFLNSLSYSSLGNKIEMEVVADSFRLAASQILSLKKSELFSDVLIVESRRDNNNQAVFVLEAVFKDKK